MILFVDQTGQLGGAELCLLDLARHRRSDSRVILFSDGPFRHELSSAGVSTNVMPLPHAAARMTKRSSPVQLVAAAAGLAGHTAALSREVKKSGLIYLNTAKALVHGALANAMHRRPSICHLHDIWSTSHFSRWNLRVLTAAANRMTLVIANSHATEAAFRAAGGHAPVRVIPNGFDPAPYDDVVDEEVERLRARWNPAGGIVVALPGRLARWKGQDIAIRALAHVPDITLWIIGGALFTEDDAAFENELREMASPLGQRVQFLGPREDIPQLLRASDIVLHCSIQPEPFGRVVAEGMFASKPVVASFAGGPPEILGDEGRDFLIPPGDPYALAEALKSLAASDTLRAELGKRLRNRATRCFSLNHVLNDLDSAISETLARR